MHDDVPQSESSPKPLIFKGRAAATNAASRFDPHIREAIDDGWGSLDEEPPPLRTEVSLDNSRTVINYINSPDIPFDRTINPYRGCEHGCIYCYARPTHAYLGYSPGLDFESRLLAKPDASELLKTELSKSNYQCAPIALGMNTDAYQPIEREYRITRGLIEVLAEANHPFSMVTKSALVERDIDLLAPMAEKKLVAIYVTITTLDRQISRRMEPRAAAPERRLETIRRLAEAGIPTGVMVAPVIPSLTDQDLEKILEAAQKNGAYGAGYVFLRLPHELSSLFQAWLQQYFPLKAAHVMSLVRQSRGGEDYVAEFGSRMRGKGLFADMLSNRFKIACTRLSLNHQRLHFDTTGFRIPDGWKANKIRDSGQMQLF